MKPTLRRAIRWAGRSWPAVSGAGVVALLLTGNFESMVDLGLVEVGVLGVLVVAIAVATIKRIRREAREQTHGPWQEVELGALLVVATYAMIHPVGGVHGPLYPLLYFLAAFLAAHLPTPGVAGVVALAIAIDAALFTSEGILRSQLPIFLVHAIFLLLFSLLARLIFAGQVASQRAEARLARQEKARLEAETARLVRVRHAAGQADRMKDEEWTNAAIAEVSQAIDNALEVAEVALATHSIAVFLLPDEGELLRSPGRETFLRLHEARSTGAPLRIDPFDSREGLIGASMRRLAPMRLCGELKGVNWYEAPTPVRSVALVPLVDRRRSEVYAEGEPGEGRVQGVLLADRLEAREFTEDDERVLVATSREVLRAIEAERVMGYIRRARDEKEFFFRSMEKLNRAHARAEVASSTIEILGDERMLALDFIALTTTRLELDTNKRVHRIERIATTLKLDRLEGHEFADNHLHVATVVRQGAPFWSNEPKVLEKMHPFDASAQLRGLRSVLICPLFVYSKEDRQKKEVLGTVVCGSRRRGHLDAELKGLIQAVAEQAGQALLRARLYEEQEEAATTDGLTKLMNHRTFQTRLDEELQRLGRQAQGLALILCDIDHFKMVNDVYGHAVGDLVLAGVASILRRTVRNTDVVARHGGEEFAILLTPTDDDGAREVAEKLRRAVEAHAFQTDLGRLRCTMSFGVATAKPGGQTAKKALFEAADSSLYESKRRGRNRVTMWGEEQEPAAGA
ncbi:MAG TPA: diguanylate cyclase [Vulgatibacter sp.]|nr:diguanylate cyclase [Vulgatibacter sp.]